MRAGGSLFRLSTFMKAGGTGECKRLPEVVWINLLADVNYPSTLFVQVPYHVVRAVAVFGRRSDKFRKGRADGLGLTLLGTLVEENFDGGPNKDGAEFNAQTPH